MHVIELHFIFVIIDRLKLFCATEAAFHISLQVHKGIVLLKPSVKVLLYPDPSLTDANGATPLHYAAAWGSVRVMIS